MEALDIVVCKSEAYCVMNTVVCKNSGVKRKAVFSCAISPEIQENQTALNWGFSGQPGWDQENPNGHREPIQRKARPLT